MTEAFRHGEANLGDTTLTSDRLVLRRARNGDLPAIHEIMSDDETMRYWSTLPHTSLEETRAWFAKMLTPAEGADEYIIEHQGAVIGKIGTWRLPEIGFFLRRDCWGQGFASEALMMFIKHAASLGCPQLKADVDPLNEASLLLLKRAGFRETGQEKATYVVGERVCDSIFLGLDLPSLTDRSSDAGGMAERDACETG